MEYNLQSVTLLLFSATIVLSKDFLLHSQHLKSCRIIFSSLLESVLQIIDDLFGIILFFPSSPSFSIFYLCKEKKNINQVDPIILKSKLVVSLS